jgi:hypothetical protein
MATRRSDVFNPNMQMDVRSGIVATANALGMDPADLATMISFETGGTFNPSQPGPTTKWGQHRGLIQFGEPQAKQYGVDWADPIGTQLGPNGAIARYFLDRGWKPGMSGMDAYSIINAGAPGRYSASDTAAGGTRGDVRDKWTNQMGGHRQKAMALLGGDTTSSGAIRHPPNAVVGTEGTGTAQVKGDWPTRPLPPTDSPADAQETSGISDTIDSLGTALTGAAGGRSSVPNVPLAKPTATLVQSQPGELLNPQAMQASRDRLAMAMARLNSGKLWVG